VDRIGAPPDDRRRAAALGTFLRSHHYGPPKDIDQTAERLPIVFVSAYGQPGSYDP
jgi:hypothetical protein